MRGVKSLSWMAGSLHGVTLGLQQGFGRMCVPFRGGAS